MESRSGRHSRLDGEFPSRSNLQQVHKVGGLTTSLIETDEEPGYESSVLLGRLRVGGQWEMKGDRKTREISGHDLARLYIATYVDRL